MDNLILKWFQLYKAALEDLLQNISTTLNRFIRDRKIIIPADDFVNKKIARRIRRIRSVLNFIK
jgi:hypothetical protein